MDLENLLSVAEKSETCSLPCLFLDALDLRGLLTAGSVQTRLGEPWDCAKSTQPARMSRPRMEVMTCRRIAISIVCLCMFLPRSTAKVTATTITAGHKTR